MTDGSALLMSVIHSLDAMGMWNTNRASNLLDSGSHFYNTYETKDGKFVSIGSIEPKFYTELIRKAGLSLNDWSNQLDQKSWTDFKEKLIEVFKEKTRDEWCQIMEGSDVCFAPVLDYKEAPNHPHNQARQTYITVDGISQPAPAPRFSRTKSQVRFGSPIAGEHRDTILEDWGVNPA